MAGTSQVEALNRKRLRAFAPLFATLAFPDLDALPGYYRGEFVGPGWLRGIAPRGLRLIHLGGWWGKEIGADCTGVNLVRRVDALERSFAFSVVATSSVVDGKPVLAIRYGPESPFPWPHVIDEVRRLDETCFLAMTVVPTGLLRRMPLPFLLRRAERPHGL